MTCLNRTWRLAKKPELIKERVNRILAEAWKKDQLILSNEKKARIIKKLEEEIEM